jgi:hypothetical protein
MIEYEAIRKERQSSRGFFTGCVPDCPFGEGARLFEFDAGSLFGHLRELSEQPLPKDTKRDPFGLRTFDS